MDSYNVLTKGSGSVGCESCHTASCSKTCQQITAESRKRTGYVAFSCWPTGCLTLSLTYQVWKKVWKKSEKRSEKGLKKGLKRSEKRSEKRFWCFSRFSCSASKNSPNCGSCNNLKSHHRAPIYQSNFRYLLAQNIKNAYLVLLHNTMRFLKKVWEKNILGRVISVSSS